MKGCLWPLVAWEAKRTARSQKAAQRSDGTAVAPSTETGALGRRLVSRDRDWGMTCRHALGRAEFQVRRDTWWERPGVKNSGCEGSSSL